MQFHEKLFIIRKLLALNQKEAANQSGINSAVLCMLEQGDKDVVPFDYFKFLYQKGIDINWFFNPSENIEDAFRNEVKDNIDIENKNKKEYVSMNQHLWVSEILALKNVTKLDKVLNELLFEIKHLNVKLKD